MKIRLEKRRSPRKMALLIVMGLVCIGLGFISATIGGAAGIIWFSVMIAHLNDYEISDKDKLRGYAISIDIHQIHKVIKEDTGVVVHYERKKDGSIKVQRFIPKDTSDFIARLKEINPKIEII